MHAPPIWIRQTSLRGPRGRWAVLVVIALAVAMPFLTSQPALAASVGLNGEGSSFAGPEVTQWSIDTAKSPYNLNVSYSSQSSGDGRFQFANQTVDYAVSDIPYQPPQFDTAQPKFPFIYVPVTAGGLAFMYHINGLSGTLQLSSYSACAIFTGAVTSWNDPVIEKDNPGLSLPNLAIHPVIRSDLAGTNFVFQEWCIHEQPALWKAFVTSAAITSMPGQVGDLSATSPRSDWPLFPNAVTQSGSANAADTVSNTDNNGYITAVETAYAIERHSPTASVQNPSGDYTQPSAVDVASALAYATQQPDGVHVLNFDGVGPHVYNPSTYSYLLARTTGWDPAKGAVLSQFANYALTLGQEKAPEIGYASLGLSLEQYGVNAIKAGVPGAVTPTAAEQAAYACGDLTPTEVQAGQTTPTCGVTNPNDSSSVSGVKVAGATATTAKGKTVTAATARTSASGAGGGGGGGGGSTDASVDPGVSLSGPSPGLAVTGMDPIPLLAGGLVIVVIGFAARRRILRRVAVRRGE